MGDSEDEFRELRGRRPREGGEEGGQARGRRWRGAGGTRGRTRREALHGAPTATATPLEAPPAEQQQIPESEGVGVAFCQLCQKDLSAMNTIRRQQHLNRCLDDLERLHPPSSRTPGIPECPICGKEFGTLKSRGSHLKRCAIKMEVPPPLLLQAVRHQQVSSFGSACQAAQRGKKRKVSFSSEQAMEKEKTAKTEDLAEDLSVAMAMSLAHLANREAKAKPPTNRRRDAPLHTKKRLKAERQTRQKPPQLPPPLLLQDPEKARQQTEERVAMLLAEMEEFPDTPPLPASALLEDEKSRQAPTGLHCSLWEFSSLTEPRAAPGSFCAVGFTLPVALSMDQKPRPATAGEVVEQVPSGAEGYFQDTDCKDLPCSTLKSGYSQKDSEALRDLVELAEEGLTLTQWKLDAQQGAGSGKEQELSNSHQNHVVQSLEKEMPQRGHCQSFLLSSLAAAFKVMVNNPHLSDLQFQVDSGEVIYAHMFVLYARCPQLMEFVDHKGFLVAEGDGVRTRRVLFDSVSGEAVHFFLSHLYAGDHIIPPHILSDVAALAIRFGVQELAALCNDQESRGLDRSEEDGAERADAFEDLLESMWMGENKETETVLYPEEGSNEDVGEQELEEIYEFAATQRKAALSKASEEKDSSGHKRQTVSGGSSPEQVLELPLANMATLEQKGDSNPEVLRLQCQDSKREDPKKPMPDPKKTTPFGEPETETSLVLVGEDQPELNESSESLFSVAQVGSFELVQQSPDIKDLPGGRSFSVLAGAPSVCPEGWTLSNGLFSNLPQPVSPPVTSSPKGRRPRFGKLSQTPPNVPVLSPSQPSVTENKEEQSVKTQTDSLGQGQDKTLDSAALPPPPSHRALEDDFILLLDSDEEMALESEQVQPGVSGKEPAVPSAAYGYLRQCVGKEDSKDPLLEVSVGCEASQQLRQGSEKEDSWAEGSNWSKGERSVLVPDTPLLGKRASSTQPSSKSGSEEHWTHRSWSSQPSPATVAPKGSLSPLPSCLAGDGKSEQGLLSGCLKSTAEVVIVDDSEEELDAEPPLPWDSSWPMENISFSEGGISCFMPSPEPKRTAALSGLSQMPAKDLKKMDNSPLTGPAALCLQEEEESDSRQQGRAAWDGEDSDDEEIFPLTQLPATQPDPKTPELICWTKEVPHTTPMTPLPSYSLMETPELKKELRRFGVRALPKRQMVLKLKEIFDYTHQSKGANPKPTFTSSQPVSHCSPAKKAPRAPKLAGASRNPCKQLLGIAEPLPSGRNGKGLPRAGGGGLSQEAEVHAPQWESGPRKGATLTEIEADRPSLTASQESTGSSVSGSDASLLSQSSSLTEFETGVLAEEEEDEGISASQAAVREADKLEALRRYIHSKPALYRHILLYQPFELAGLQAELKQNGIRIALGKLLDFLDAHCITFTTAEARKEKQQRSKRKGRKRF